MISVSGAAAKSSGDSELRSCSAAATNCIGRNEITMSCHCRGCYQQSREDEEQLAVIGTLGYSRAAAGMQALLSDVP